MRGIPSAGGEHPGPDVPGGKDAARPPAFEGAHWRNDERDPNLPSPFDDNGSDQSEMKLAFCERCRKMHFFYKDRPCVLPRTTTLYDGKEKPSDDSQASLSRGSTLRRNKGEIPRPPRDHDGT